MSSYFPMTMSQNTCNTSNKMKCPKSERIKSLAKNKGNRNIVLVQYHKHTSS